MSIFNIPVPSVTNFIVEEALSPPPILELIRNITIIAERCLTCRHMPLALSPHVMQADTVGICAFVLNNVLDHHQQQREITIIEQSACERAYYLLLSRMPHSSTPYPVAPSPSTSQSFSPTATSTHWALPQSPHLSPLQHSPSPISSPDRFSILVQRPSAPTPAPISPHIPPQETFMIRPITPLSMSPLPSPSFPSTSREAPSTSTARPDRSGSPTPLQGGTISLLQQGTEIDDSSDNEDPSSAPSPIPTAPTPAPISPYIPPQETSMIRPLTPLTAPKTRFLRKKRTTPYTYGKESASQLPTHPFVSTSHLPHPYPFTLTSTQLPTTQNAPYPQLHCSLPQQPLIPAPLPFPPSTSSVDPQRMAPPTMPPLPPVVRFQQSTGTTSIDTICLAPEDIVTFSSQQLATQLSWSQKPNTYPSIGIRCYDYEQNQPSSENAAQPRSRATYTFVAKKTFFSKRDIKRRFQLILENLNKALQNAESLEISLVDFIIECSHSLYTSEALSSAWLHRFVILFLMKVIYATSAAYQLVGPVYILTRATFKVALRKLEAECSGILGLNHLPKESLLSPQERQSYITAHPEEAQNLVDLFDTPLVRRFENVP